MSRFELGGHEDPIPNLALPDPNLSGDLPVQSLELVNGVDFLKADWVALGYTHYEVWCIGAVGGKGASPNDATFYPYDGSVRYNGLAWHIDTHEEAYTSDLWELVLQSADAIASGSNTTMYTGIAPIGTTPPPQGVIEWTTYAGAIYWILTPRGLAELQNPSHLVQISEFHDPYLVENGGIQGGGGGGGGLHVVSGALADIPDTVPVSVGQPGANAIIGQILVNGVWTPHVVHADPILAFTNREIDTSSFNIPGAGGDGGASSFGDIGMASGGKGGGPSIIWQGAQRAFAGYGGQGGKGGQTVAGGGALGSTTKTANGKDGTWDGTVGEGGGGGRGGFVEAGNTPIGSIVDNVIKVL